MITGRDLIEAGLPQNKRFGTLLTSAREMERHHGAETAIATVVADWKAAEAARPALLEMGEPKSFSVAMADDEDVLNKAAVLNAMTDLSRLPTFLRGAVMPDACPAGVIPVGGVAEMKGTIHPGLHSADVCCSVMMTAFPPSVSLKDVLDAGHSVTHFGPRGFPDPAVHTVFDRLFRGNPFLDGLEAMAAHHFGTQGDGNHFLFVGRSEQTRDVAMITHHGSRGPGAALYKRALKAAGRHTAKVAKSIPPSMAWLDYDSDEGRDYWRALQIIRAWTKASHAAIHMKVAKKLHIEINSDFLWNEHNFVFQRDPGVFLHAKGATPAWGYHADDADRRGRVLIPLNMGQPVLVVRGLDKVAHLGFAPHGAGRNMSRTKFIKNGAESDRLSELETMRAAGLDIRAYDGGIDHSELPSAYKSADAIVAEIERFQLGRVVDRIMPYGSIMTGNGQLTPWR